MVMSCLYWQMADCPGSRAGELGSAVSGQVVHLEEGRTLAMRC